MDGWIYEVVTRHDETVNIEGVPLEDLLAGLFNARRQSHGQVDPIDGDDVIAKLKDFRQRHGSWTQMSNASFITWLLGVPVRLTNDDTEMLVAHYDNLHGKGMAALVVSHIDNGNGTDTRRLRHCDPSTIDVVVSVGLFLTLVVIGLLA